ncbi:hypothetical protein [Micromonospora fiedleri]|uniref:hypothetical protein n=1 Tax=Micromonospora fiedleri TaxID=1157498 RepID=UPI0027DB7790|nr:hypothetical protein [Micromonospora fiedleri]
MTNSADLPPTRRTTGRVWHLFNLLALANLVLLFTADDTAARVLHAIGTAAFAVAAMAARPPRPARRP